MRNRFIVFIAHYCALLRIRSGRLFKNVGKMNRWTWRSRDIRMNCVSPGPVSTPILPDFLETLGERAEEGMKISAIRFAFKMIVK
jgi:hypothetical protein